MTRRQEIEQILNRHSLMYALNYFDGERDLNIILSIQLKKRDFEDIDSLFKKLPKTGKYDKLTVDILSSCYRELDDEGLAVIISTIVDDNIKLNLLERYRSFHDYLPVIINSFNSDELKKEQFRKYIDHYDSDCFSDYIWHIKNDEIKLSELDNYYDSFPECNITFIMDSIESDEVRIKVFDKYIEKTPDNIIIFIRDLKNDENKVKVLDEYIDLVCDEASLERIFRNMKESALLSIFNKYKSILNEDSLICLIMKFGSEDSQIKLFNEAARYLSPKIISLFIADLSSKQKKMKLFASYIEQFTSEEFNKIFSRLETDERTLFFKKYEKYIPGETLADLWFNNKVSNFANFHVTKDQMLKKYIDRFDREAFINVMDHLYYTHHTKDRVINYIRGFTNNRVTIRNFYNAFAFAESNYFINELLPSDVFTDDERSLCKRLSGGNSSFYEYFIFELFDIPILKNNRYFLSKLAKYPEISVKIIDIYHKKPDLLPLLLLMIKQIYEYEIYHDVMINDVIEVFFDKKNKFLENIDMKSLDKKRKTVLLYKLLNIAHYNGNLIEVDINNNDDLDTYEERRVNLIDKYYQESTSIYKKKNLLFNKIFGITLNKAKKIIQQYGFSLDKLSDKFEFRYLKIISDILNEEDLNKIDYYYNNISVLSMEERYLLEYEIKKEFGKLTIDSLYKVEDETPITFMGKGVPVYKPKGDFFLLVNSTVAFFDNETIKNYSKFVNKNSNIQNHGICCSLISNQNICQTAPVNDVIFGYNDFSSSSIQLAGTTDIFSKNTNFCLDSSEENRFMTPQDCINETVFDLNEYVLERIELRKDRKRINLQPSYVVLYDYSNEDIVKKSIKAASQLKIPIVYLYTKEIAHREAGIISNLVREARDNLDIDCFEKFVVRFLNNAHGTYRYCHKIYDTYFNTNDLDLYVTSMTSAVDSAYCNKAITLEEAANIYDKMFDILIREYKKSKKDSRQFIVDYRAIINNMRSSINTKIKENLKRHSM